MARWPKHVPLGQNQGHPPPLLPKDLERRMTNRHAALKQSKTCAHNSRIAQSDRSQPNAAQTPTEAQPCAGAAGVSWRQAARRFIYADVR